MPIKRHSQQPGPAQPTTPGAGGFYTPPAPVPPVQTTTGIDKRRTALIGGVLAAAISSFILLPLACRPSDRSNACTVGVDVQGSASGMRTSYDEWLGPIVRHCMRSAHSRIVVFAVTAETDRLVGGSVTLDAASLELTDNKTRNEEIIDAAVTEFLDTVAPTLDNAPKPPGLQGTDLLGAPRLAAQFFNSHDDETELILLTDGVNERRPYNFTNPKTLDQGLSEAAIRDLRATGRLPELDGTKVYVFGVGAGSTSRSMTPEMVNNIEVFWTDYFDLAGAELIAYDKGFTEGVF